MREIRTLEFKKTIGVDTLKFSRLILDGKIPEAAFREAIANALIHRVWDVESQIRVLMFDDRIEVISPGGLPSGITVEEYLSGRKTTL